MGEGAPPVQGLGAVGLLAQEEPHQAGEDRPLDDEQAGDAGTLELITAKVVSPDYPTHHDPDRLAETVMRLARRSS